MKKIPVLLLALIIFLVTSCRAFPIGPTPTPTSTPIAENIAHQAGEKMLQVESLHFMMELSGALTYLDEPPTIALKRVEGDVTLPDRVRAIVRISSLGMVSEVGIIGLGEEQYITNPLNQKWEQLPVGQGWYFDPALLFDPNYGIESILRASEWTFLQVGEEDSSDDHYVLHGQVPGEKFLYLTSGMITSGRIDTTFWVGRETFYVREIKLLEIESDVENPTQWIIKLSDFDQPVDIVAPPLELEE